MGGDVLSQAEVESLLSAMSGGNEVPGAKAKADSAKTPSRSSGSLADAMIVGGGRPREKITPYDFKRPERVGKEQMRALQTLHEGFQLF